MKNPNVSNLDLNQMMKQTLDAEMDAQRVIIVSGEAPKMTFEMDEGQSEDPMEMGSGDESEAELDKRIQDLLKKKESLKKI